jgi:hypothetical protein
MKDPYYSRSEVSNSDLSALKKLLYGGQEFDPTEAYKFGTLIDCMLTEPDKVNFFNYTCSGEQYTPEQFEQARQMKRSFFKDDLARRMLEQASTQSIMFRDMDIEFEGFKFSLPVRCKWDIWMQNLNWGGDIKSTTATSQKQFEAAAKHFDYDRQRAFYMDIAGSNQDILIAISKVNFKVFKIPIKRGDDFFQSGQDKYRELAFQYWNLIA